MVRLIASHKRGGLHFGGHASQAFWVIPMGAKAADYDCSRPRGRVRMGRSTPRRRLDLETGIRANVLGTLRVTDWPACYVGGVLVPGWVGVVVRE